MASDAELSQGASRCDVCGVDTPHQHDPEIVEIERLIHPAFEKTTVPCGFFGRSGRFSPYHARATEALWQHFLSGWMAAKRVYAVREPSDGR